MGKSCYSLTTIAILHNRKAKCPKDYALRDKTMLRTYQAVLDYLRAGVLGPRSAGPLTY